MHRAGIALKERKLRKLQRQVPGLTAERGGLLEHTGSTNPDLTMEPVGILLCNALPVSGKHYNTKRSYSALGYRPPDPEAIVPMDPRPLMH